MSADEDEKEYELKDLLVQIMEANGTWPKMRAQIKANVFKALEEADKNTQNIIKSNQSVKKVLSTTEGRLAAALVRDFLEMCELDFTLSVFDPELNSTIIPEKRDKLLNQLKINETDRDMPVLVSLLKNGGASISNGFSRTNGSKENSFEASDHDSRPSSARNHIDSKKNTNANGGGALGELPPLFNSNKKPMNSARDYDKKLKDDDNYDDDFTSGAPTPRTQRRVKNRSGIISDEEIDENLSYMEESSKLDEVTIDRSISTIQGTNEADYIEDVSI